MVSPNVNPTKSNENGVLKDIVASFYGLVRSEIRLAKTEFTHHTRDMANHGIASAASIAMIFFGAMSLVAFLVIGLGHLFGDRFWLSALLVGIAFAGTGGLMLKSAIRKIREDADIPETRHSLEEDRDMVQNKVHDITDRVKQTRIPT